MIFLFVVRIVAKVFKSVYIFKRILKKFQYKLNIIRKFFFNTLFNYVRT